MEKKGSSETRKGFRATETHERSIYGLYTPAISCRPVVSIEMRFFFPKAPQWLSPIGFASRKRLPDYVCPATDGDADERLIYRTTYITGSKTAATLLPLLLLLLLRLLFLLFPCFFIVLFVSADRLLCLPLSRLYIDHDATSSPMYPSVRPFSISIPAKRISRGFTFIFRQSRLRTRYRVPDTNMRIFFPWRKKFPFLSFRYTILLSNIIKRWVDVTESLFSRSLLEF